MYRFSDCFLHKVCAYKRHQGLECKSKFCYMLQAVFCALRYHQKIYIYLSSLNLLGRAGFLFMKSNWIEVSKITSMQNFFGFLSLLKNRGTITYFSIPAKIIKYVDNILGFYSTGYKHCWIIYWSKCAYISVRALKNSWNFLIIFTMCSPLLPLLRTWQM